MLSDLKFIFFLTAAYIGTCLKLMFCLLRFPDPCLKFDTVLASSDTDLPFSSWSCLGFRVFSQILAPLATATLLEGSVALQILNVFLGRITQTEDFVALAWLLSLLTCLGSACPASPADSSGRQISTIMDLIIPVAWL